MDFAGVSSKKLQVGSLCIEIPVVDPPASSASRGGSSNSSNRAAGSLRYGVADRQQGTNTAQRRHEHSHTVPVVATDSSKGHSRPLSNGLSQQQQQQWQGGRNGRQVAPYPNLQAGGSSIIPQFQVAPPPSSLSARITHHLHQVHSQDTSSHHVQSFVSTSAVVRAQGIRGAGVPPVDAQLGLWRQRAQYEASEDMGDTSGHATPAWRGSHEAQLQQSHLPDPLQGPGSFNPSSMLVDRPNPNLTADGPGFLLDHLPPPQRDYGDALHASPNPHPPFLPPHAALFYGSSPVPAHFQAGRGHSQPPEASVPLYASALAADGSHHASHLGQGLVTLPPHVSGNQLLDQLMAEGNPLQEEQHTGAQAPLEIDLFDGFFDSLGGMPPGGLPPVANDAPVAEVQQQCGSNADVVQNSASHTATTAVTAAAATATAGVGAAAMTAASMPGPIAPVQLFGEVDRTPSVPGSSVCACLRSCAYCAAYGCGCTDENCCCSTLGHDHGQGTGAGNAHEGPHAVAPKANGQGGSSHGVPEANGQGATGGQCGTDAGQEMHDGRVGLQSPPGELHPYQLPGPATTQRSCCSNKRASRSQVDIASAASAAAGGGGGAVSVSGGGGAAAGDGSGGCSASAYLPPVPAAVVHASCSSVRVDPSAAPAGTRRMGLPAQSHMPPAISCCAPNGSRAVTPLSAVAATTMASPASGGSRGTLSVSHPPRGPQAKPRQHQWQAAGSADDSLPGRMEGSSLSHAPDAAHWQDRQHLWGNATSGSLPGRVGGGGGQCCGSGQVSPSPGDASFTALLTAAIVAASEGDGDSLGGSRGREGDTLSNRSGGRHDSEHAGRGRGTAGARGVELGEEEGWEEWEQGLEAAAPWQADAENNTRGTGQKGSTVTTSATNAGAVLAVVAPAGAADAAWPQRAVPTAKLEGADLETSGGEAAEALLERGGLRQEEDSEGAVERAMWKLLERQAKPPARFTRGTATPAPQIVDEAEGEDEEEPVAAKMTAGRVRGAAAVAIRAAVPPGSQLSGEPGWEESETAMVSTGGERRERGGKGRRGEKEGREAQHRGMDMVHTGSGSKGKKRASSDQPDIALLLASQQPRPKKQKRMRYAKAIAELLKEQAASDARLRGEGDAEAIPSRGEKRTAGSGRGRQGGGQVKESLREERTGSEVRLPGKTGLVLGSRTQRDRGSSGANGEEGSPSGDRGPTTQQAPKQAQRQKVMSPKPAVNEEAPGVATGGNQNRGRDVGSRVRSPGCAGAQRAIKEGAATEQDGVGGGVHVMGQIEGGSALKVSDGEGSAAGVKAQEDVVQEEGRKRHGKGLYGASGGKGSPMKEMAALRGQLPGPRGARARQSDTEHHAEPDRAGTSLGRAEKGNCRSSKSSGRRGKGSFVGDLSRLLDVMQRSRSASAAATAGRRRVRGSAGSKKAVGNDMASLVAQLSLKKLPPELLLMALSALADYQAEEDEEEEEQEEEEEEEEEGEEEDQGDEAGDGYEDE